MYHTWFSTAFIKAETQHKFTMIGSISIRYKRKGKYNINNSHWMQN